MLRIPAGGRLWDQGPKAIPTGKGTPGPWVVVKEEGAPGFHGAPCKPSGRGSGSCSGRSEAEPRRHGGVGREVLAQQPALRKESVFCCHINRLDAAP